jgi:hypothetical protein
VSPPPRSNDKKADKIADEGRPHTHEIR